jgi:REP element-mobilizing transposase RayT
MTYNPLIHKRQSIRLHGYDYSQTGTYFVTICTYKKEHFFGEIINAEMKLNVIGQYAFYQWKKIPHRFNDVELDEFIIMPNHIHGIIVINRRGEGSENESLGGKRRLFSDSSPLHHDEQLQHNGTLPGSIGAIIQNYKSGISRKISTMPGMKNVKLWQMNYYDHIIRNEEDHARIVEYIQQNPVQWEQDELFTGGL